MERPEIIVTMTATLRPEIMYVTLDSFFENLFQDWPVSLICNIDPVGGQKYLEDEVANVCRKYFKKNLIMFSTKAHFGRAFYKCWRMIGASDSLVFHLEDDWKLLRSVDLGAMVELLNQRFDILRLPQNDAGEAYKDWNLTYPFIQDCFEVPYNLRTTIGFCGHPSLLRASFVREAMHFLDPEKNPEKQLKGIDRARIKWLMHKRLGVFSKPGDKKAIEDIGRKWRQEKNIGKEGSAAFFTEWSNGFSRA